MVLTAPGAENLPIPRLTWGFASRQHSLLTDACHAPTEQRRSTASALRRKTQPQRNAVAGLHVTGGGERLETPNPRLQVRGPAYARGSQSGSPGTCTVCSA